MKPVIGRYTTINQTLTTVLVIIHVTLLMTGCGGEGRRGESHAPQPGDTLYTGERAMEIYAREPERALTIIDSAEIVGNLPDYQASLLRAKVYSRSMEALRLDTAQTICEALLQHDSIREDANGKTEVIDLLININRLRQDNEQWLHWATEKADLCREQAKTVSTDADRNKAETEQLRAEAEIGVVMAHLGQRDEALARLDYTIARLDRPGSVNRLDALVIALKRKINVLLKAGRYADVIPVANQILDRLNHFESHTADYAEDSQRLPANSHDRACYLDFYRAQANLFQANAYAKLGDKPQARERLRHYEQSDFGHTFNGRREAATLWTMLGDYDKVLATYRDMKQHYQSDTIQDEYAVMLRNLAEIAEQQGRLAAALDYRRRYEALDDTLNTRLIESKANDYAARYQLQEQRLETEQALARADRIRMINIGIGMLLFMVVAAQGWRMWHNRIIQRKNRSLAQQITETIKYKKMLEGAADKQKPGMTDKQKPDMATGEDESGPEPDNAPDNPDAPDETEDSTASADTISHDELFERIHSVILRDKLFLDPGFDRQALIDHLHLSARQVGKAFAQGSDYASITQFINDCRLEHACQQLTDSYASIDEVSAASGFSVRRTFSRLFKEKYGLTPTEYRNQQRWRTEGT